MIGLTANIEAQKAQVDAFQHLLDQARNQALASATNDLPYWDAKRALQDKKALYHLLGDRIENVQADLSIPRSTLTMIINPAVPPSSPSQPNRWAGAGLLVCGLLLAAFGVKSLRFGLKSAR